MGNQQPSESHMGDRLRCYKCNSVLPPCTSFDNFYRQTINGQEYYVFNGGQYFRAVGQDNMYQCSYCFYKPIRDQEERRRQEEERRRQEEERRRQEEERRRQEEERRKQEEERQRRRGEELNQRLSESLRRATEQRENEQRSVVSEESKRDILKVTMDEFQVTNEPDSDSDELLEILSAKTNISLQSLSLSQLSANHLAKILSAMNTLLFDEWMRAPPSFSTLQHTHVFITELCVLSLQTSLGVSLQSISEHAQYLVGSISQSACDVCESFLLSQALYLTLMHFFSEHSDSDVVLMAKRWAEEELSSEQIFIIEFLSILLSSLQKTVESASVFILKMEIQTLKLLLSSLRNINVKETHSELSQRLFRLVQTNQWTPVEAMTLLTALSKKYTEDEPISKVLMLVQLYELPPEWTDESGRSLIHALDCADPSSLHEDLQKTIRRKDELSLGNALAELKMLWSLDDAVTEKIKSITTGVLQYQENTTKDSPPKDDSSVGVTSDANVKKSLCQLCRAVFHTKGWWPTVKMMLHWCVLMLTENSEELEPADLEADVCVIAMFAAQQALKGNKVDIVLSSEGNPKERAEEWSDFYKYLGLTVDTNTKETKESGRDAYEAKILYGMIPDFVSDYVQQGIEAIETGNTRQSRQFIFEGNNLSFTNTLETLNDCDSLCFAAEVLQSLMGKFNSEDKELRHRFMKALFQVLHSNTPKNKVFDSKILRVLLKFTRKEPSPTEVFILTSLENLLQNITTKTEGEEDRASSAGRWCLETLSSSVEQLKPSAPLVELLQMVADLESLRLWSAAESLNLLAALVDHHHDEDCIHIKKILHLMAVYQVSSQWMDDNDQSLLMLVDKYKTKDLIKHFEKSLRDEKVKSIDTVFDELRKMGDIDDQTLSKSHSIVTHVRNLISTGEIKKHTDVEKARTLSHSRETEDLQQVLAVLCNAVHHSTGEKWWPRDTQMISWCLLALSDTGRLLEMGTGEGKSCVIAMFAALRVLQGEKVDIVSSSSVLCQRDADEWNNFYKYFQMTADTNTNKMEDSCRSECYQKDVVYGTIEAFAADHLRQIFEMKEVRPNRQYQCIIIDEVDSLLLDQGVQLTYLSSPMVSMQHLNVVLALIWSHVSQFGFLSAEHQTFVRSPPASFFKAIFDSIDTEGTEIKDPMDILRIAEETGTVQEGFTEEIYQVKNDELLQKLKTVSQDAMVNFFHEIENYVPYGFTVYTLDDQGSLCQRKQSPYNNQDIPELTFLVLNDGLCCSLYDSEEDLIKPIADIVLQKVQFTPCENNKGKINIPGFLRNLIEKKVPVWVQNAFLAMQLREGREYVIQGNSVCPVDFRSTGIIELNKKWGDGLQQFVEIKHKIKLSTISVVTNYVSNISFFEMYHGKIYGTTGTLGSKPDILFLQELYPSLSACKMPPFNRKKLFELKGTLTTSAEEWRSEIKRVVLDQTSPNSYREGRAALVICETINKANEIYEELKSSIQGKIILYCRSDKDSLSRIDTELNPGDVIVATNLAGRGTDIKVSKTVNNNGGLFVILSFLSMNTRVELQAFGRTARKGKPGSAQIIMCTEHQQQSLRTASSLEEAKETRDQYAGEMINHMKKDITELRLREELFSDYCGTLQEIHASTDDNEKKAVVAIMNEFWGIWLQIKSEDIDNLKRNDLKSSLKADLSWAKTQCQSQSSPSLSFYHYIKFGNVALNKQQWEESCRLFEKATNQDKSWAAIAFYSHAYCTIKQKKEDYLSKAIEDLEKAKESLIYLNEELIVCLQVVKMSPPSTKNETSLEKQFLTKQKMWNCLEENINEAIKKLDEIKAEGRNAVAKNSTISSLVSKDEEDFQEEASNLFRQGLQYIFSVEKEPRFPWEALLVFFLGIAQIIGGALLTAFTFGTLAQVGMGLITEGISDCISGIESMVTGEFSWKSWAIEKAISIGVSLLGFGIGKLIAKGFKACKLLLKGFGKELKSLPKFLAGQAKEGLSTVAKTNMKNAAKLAVKTMAEELITYGLGKAEEEIIKQILAAIENDIKKGIAHDVKSNLEKGELGSLVDSIILSHVVDEEQLQVLLRDKDRKTKLLNVFTELSKNAVQSFYADLSWQNKLNSSIQTVIDKVQKQVKGDAKILLTTIKLVHMGALAAEATAAVLSLSSKFFQNLQEKLTTFKKDHLSEKKQKHQSPQDTELLKDFKQELADTISNLLAAALVEVFHQKFSSHLVSWMQSEAHGVITNHVRPGLKTDRTEELLRAGQNNSYIKHMPVDKDSRRLPAKGTSESVKTHAEKIKDTKTPGNILDIRVLSETTGTKVVILTESSQGKLTKMQQVHTNTNPASQEVTLIYRPKSDKYPDGHYDVLINNRTVSINSEDKSCLFHALARGMNPDASEDQISKKADELRHMEADALLKQPGRWEPFIKRKEWTDNIRGGDWFMAEGAKPKKEEIEKIKESLEILQREVGDIQRYDTWIKYRNENPGMGQFINADHQPPVSCILDAGKMNQNSKLAKAFLEVGTGSSTPDTEMIEKMKDRHGPKLPAVYVPAEVHGEFLSTISPKFRELLTDTIQKDDVVGTFKLTILGSVPRFRLKSNEDFNSFNTPLSKTRLDVFEESFPHHSKKMVENWHSQLNGVMTNDDLKTITTWINNRGYNDQNDDYRNLVSNCLSTEETVRKRKHPSDNWSNMRTHMTRSVTDVLNMKKYKDVDIDKW